MEFSFQSFKLLFGDDFEESCELVPEDFSTVLSLTEPFEFAAFQAWMLGSLKCPDNQSVEIFAFIGYQAARATASVGDSFDKTLITSASNAKSVDPSFFIV